MGSRWTRVLHFSSAELVGKDVPIGRFLHLAKESELMCCVQAEHNVLNGAIGGMDSSYYAFCGVGALGKGGVAPADDDKTHHIDTDTDLIILEFDVNDLP